MPVVTMPYVTKAMSQGLSLVGYSLPGNFMNSQFHLQHFAFAQVPELKLVHKAQRSVTKSKMDEVTCCLRMYVCMYALFKILSWRHSQGERLDVTDVTFYTCHHDSKHDKYNHLPSSESPKCRTIDWPSDSEDLHVYISWNLFYIFATNAKQNKGPFTPSFSINSATTLQWC